ncbi:chlorophyll a/b-binding protein [Nonomuraea antimicrobica]|uniref:chlorophyll a/b-binding protein n=1 Tax=Nonomuraea antimicrobica TaxID=561173 RepID=UPI0031EDFE88
MSSISLSTILSIVSLIVMTVMLLGGAVLMATRRREHGRGAMLGMVGCIVLLVGVALNALIVFLLPALGDSWSPSEIEIVLAIHTLASLIVQIAGTVLLIFAVIARRNPPQPVQPGHPSHPGHPGQQPWQQQPYQQQPVQQQPGWQAPPRPPFGEGQG